MTEILSCCVKTVCKYSNMGLRKCTPQSVQLSSVETNTMGLKIDIVLTKASFSFLKLCFICLELNCQNDNFCVFNPVLPRSQKCPPSPKYWVFLSDFSWKWYVLLFSTLLYIYFSILVQKVPVVQKHYMVVLYL